MLSTYLAERRGSDSHVMAAAPAVITAAACVRCLSCICVDGSSASCNEHVSFTGAQ